MQQEAGNDSTNIQIAGNVNVGISVDQARQIALDVFKANFYEFSEKAAKKALERAEEITEDFVNKFFTETPHLISKLEEPAVQSSMFNAQKEYAKTGDKELEERLLELLVARIDSEERSLKQIVLDEAILIIPKLTNDQLDILTLIFSIVALNNSDITNIPSLIQFLNIRILNFYPIDPPSYSFFTHLQFCGCCIVIAEGASYMPLDDICRTQFKGLFAKGFSEEEFRKEVDEDISKYRSLFIKSLRNPVALQFNALTDKDFDERINPAFIDFVGKLKSFWEKNTMSAVEVKQYLIDFNPRFENLIKDWKESELKTIKLTSVGNIIAALNYNKKTGRKIDFNQLI